MDANTIYTAPKLRLVLFLCSILHLIGAALARFKVDFGKYGAAKVCDDIFAVLWKTLLEQEFDQPFQKFLALGLPALNIREQLDAVSVQ